MKMKGTACSFCPGGLGKKYEFETVARKVRFRYRVKNISTDIESKVVE